MNSPNTFRRLFARIAGTTLIVIAASFAPQAMAQQVMKIVVSFGPGGGSDLFARAVADKLAKRIGRPVIIDSRPGAGGVIAAIYAKTAPPDGNTILLTSTSLGIQSARPNTKVDLRTDFLPLITAFAGAHTLYVPSTLPVTDVRSLIAYDKAHPNALSYGSFGVGSHTHMAMELLKLRTGMQLIHVPYRSNAEALTSILKEETQVSMTPYATLEQYVDNGKVRPIALSSAAGGVVGAKKLRLPGMAESGVPDYNVLFWFGFHAPLGTPDSIMNSLNENLNVVIKDPDVVAIINREFGAAPVGGTRKEFGDFTKHDIDEFETTIRKTGMKLDD